MSNADSSSLESHYVSVDKPCQDELQYDEDLAIVGRNQDAMVD
jgi:hypothetical protein